MLQLHGRSGDRVDAAPRSRGKGSQHGIRYKLHCALPQEVGVRANRREDWRGNQGMVVQTGVGPRGPTHEHPTMDVKVPAPGTGRYRRGRTPPPPGGEGTATSKAVFLGFTRPLWQAVLGDVTMQSPLS